MAKTMVNPSVGVVTKGRGNFEALLEETIVTSIRDLLGESSMRAIVYHLNLARLGGDPHALHERLHSLLAAPAAIIEEIIVKDLFNRLDLLYFPKGEFDFERYVNSAREVYSKGGQRTA